MMLVMERQIDKFICIILVPPLRQGVINQIGSMFFPCSIYVILLVSEVCCVLCVFTIKCKVAVKCAFQFYTLDVLEVFHCTLGHTGTRQYGL